MAGIESSPHPAAQSISRNIQRGYQLMDIRTNEDLVELARGQIPFAYMDDDNIAPYEARQRVGFIPSDMPRTVLTLGNSGTGKTTLSQIVLCENVRFALSAGIRQTNMVFDLKGGFKFLLPHLRSELSPQQMVLLRVRRDRKNTFYENFLEPPTPKINIDQWIGVIVNTMRDATGLRHESASLFLRAAMNEVSKRNGEPPSLLHLIPGLYEMRPTKFIDRVQADYFSRAIHRLIQVWAEAPYTFACTRGMFGKLTEYLLVIIDLSECGSFVTDFIIQTFLTKLIWYSQLEIGFEQEPMRFCVFLDEASRIFGANKAHGLVGESVQSDFLRISRSFGIWTFLCNQDLTSLSLACRKVTGAKIVFPIDDSEHRAIAESMGLTSSEQFDMLRSLERGQAMVKLYSRTGLPAFRVRVPQFSLNHSISEQEIDAINDPALKGIAVKPVDENLHQRVISIVYHQAEIEHEDQARTDEPGDALRMLLLFAKYPFRTVNEHLKALMKDRMVSGSQEFYRKVKPLTASGLAESCRIKLDASRGAAGVYLVPTGKGVQALVDAGLWKKEAPLWKGKGGFIHVCIARYVAQKFQAGGFTAKIEAEKGAGCDVSVFHEGQPYAACEVSVSTLDTDEFKNILRDLGSGIRKDLTTWPRIHVIVACTARDKEGHIILDGPKSTEKKRRIQSLLNDDIRSRVSVMTFEEFRKEKLHVR
jgi:hypothetical protein